MQHSCLAPQASGLKSHSFSKGCPNGVEPSLSGSRPDVQIPLHYGHQIFLQETLLSRAGLLGYDAVMRFSLKAAFVVVTIACVVAAFSWYAYLFTALSVGLAMVSAAVIGTVAIPFAAYQVFQQRRTSKRLDQDSNPERLVRSKA